MRILLAMLAALSLAVFSTTQASADSPVVTSFTPEQLTEIVTALSGSEFENKTLESGTKILRFKAYDLHYTLVFRVCKPDCRGLLMLINFNTDGVNVTTDMLNEFNSKFDYATASLEKGQVIVARYVIADGGVTTENIGANILNFFYVPKVLIDHIKANQTVSFRSTAPSQQSAYNRSGYQGSVTGAGAPETHFTVGDDVVQLSRNSLARVMR